MTGPRDFAMSLDEIARELGTTRQNVYNLEQRALRKLRARPIRFVRFCELVEMRKQLQGEREQIGGAA